MPTDSAVMGLETFPIKGKREKNLSGDVQEKRDFAKGVAFLGDITKLYLKSMTMNELASEPLFPFPSVQQTCREHCQGYELFLFDCSRENNNIRELIDNIPINMKGACWDFVSSDAQTLLCWHRVLLAV